LEAAASVVALDLHMPSAPTVVLKEEAKPMWFATVGLDSMPRANAYVGRCRKHLGVS
jgi:hypothetical protein